MAAVYVNNIVINAGSDFHQVYFLEDLGTNSITNLSGYTVVSQMRKHSASSSYINFETAILDPTLGILAIGLPSSVTSNIKPGRYIFDVLAINDIVTTRIIEGMALVREGATK
jgi:hypothetical protein